MLDTKLRNSFIALVIVCLIVGAYFFTLNNQGRVNNFFNVSSKNSQPKDPVVKNTSTVNGVLPAPQGISKDIPIETAGIIESNTVEYPDQNAVQYTISYKTNKTISEKYTEYKNYLTSSGYRITEGGTNTVKNLSGIKGKASISVTISKQDTKTLVQISYLVTR